MRALFGHGPGTVPLTWPSRTCLSSSERLLVGGERRIRYGGPREALPDPLAGRSAESVAKLTVAEQPLEGRAQGAHVTRRHEDARLAVHDEVEEPADRARHHRPAVGHRLRAD